MCAFGIPTYIIRGLLELEANFQKHSLGCQVFNDVGHIPLYSSLVEQPLTNAVFLSEAFYVPHRSAAVFSDT